MGDYGVGPIAAQGAVFDDFRLGGALGPEEAPALIEIDRLPMAARPGFERKLLPLRIDPSDGTAYSGGRYLLDTYEDAQAFADWVANEFEIDGVKLVDRPTFLDLTASVWRVLGAHDFKDVRESQQLVRVEIWDLAGVSAVDRIANDWPSVRDQAEEADRASIWLLGDERSSRVATVTVADRLATPRDEGPDFAGLELLGKSPSPGAAWEAGGLVGEKLFDRTSWVFTVWFPTRHGSFPDAVWPNSPPLPAPAPAAIGAGAASAT